MIRTKMVAALAGLALMGGTVVAAAAPAEAKSVSWQTATKTSTKKSSTAYQPPFQLPGFCWAYSGGGWIGYSCR